MSPAGLATEERITSAVEVQPPSPTGPDGHDAERRSAPERDSDAVRLAAFAALAAFGSVHWAGLVVDAPIGRALAWVTLATGAAAALTGLRRVALPTIARSALAAVIVLVCGAASLAIAGLSVRLLAPANLGELIDGVDRGLAGIQSANWPYDGPEAWVRRVILLGAPLLVTAAAAVAFWPARFGLGLRRGAGLVLLLTLYGTAVTEHDPGEPLLRGLFLVVLVACWLWLPRLPVGRLAHAGAFVAAAALCALPLAGRLDGDRPWWDYRAWSWFGGGRQISFDWTHSYGPLDWPQDGATLLNVKSARPHYWKAETLDRFDGFRWLRSRANATTAAGAELPSGLEPRGREWGYYEFNPRWDRRIRFTVRSLRSEFIVGAGTTYSVRGAGVTAGTADGTTLKLDEPLEEGDTYTVRAYVPEPSVSQMRRAPRSYPPTLEQYTEILLPRRGEDAAAGKPFPGDASRSAQPAQGSVTVPLRGSRLVLEPVAERRLRASPYGPVYRLARRLAAGAPTAYDAVRRVERHFGRGFRYDERPPRRGHPLAAFILRDRAGYCQQFSGAMALMLRMAGIPARVATGFGSGSSDPHEREFRVRDLDAHSWVEVYFAGIGWVAFDPTPAAAPARRSLTTNVDRADGGSAGEVREQDPGRQNPDTGPGDPAAEDGSTDRGGLPWWAFALGLTGLGAAGAVVLALHARRRRPAGGGALAEAQARELESALRRLGWQVPGGSTLLALERILERVSGGDTARYAGALRTARYAPRSGRLPGGRERRALRRALTARAGLRGRLRGLAAIPPGGPRD